MAEIKDEVNSNNQNNGSGKQADKIISLINESNAVLFHDEYGEPYARFGVGDHFESWKIRSKHFKRWLCHLYWEKYKQVPNNESVNAAYNIIEAKACYQGRKYNLRNRVALHEGSIWYDLGNWQAVRISSEGWEVVSDPPILFRSYAHQKGQVEPVRCKHEEISEVIEILSSLVNIKDEQQKLLFLINLICSFIPDIPHPIDVLHGDQGTAKTTTSTIKKELTDPSELKNLRFSNNYNEFVQQASHHWHIPLDNLTTLPGWFSDTLCRVVTGEGFSKRELYTNDEDVIYSFRRCITINGINMVPSKPDILDRSLIFEFESIPQTKRIDEALFWEQFNEMKPRYLGAIFSVLSKAMTIHSDIELNSKPRMADFARWGTAVAIALDHSEEKFMQAFQNNISIQNTEALEANPISRALIHFMENRTEWKGSATDLLQELYEITSELNIDTKDRRFPNDPRWLWRRLKEVKPNLAAIGIELEKDDSNRVFGRKILIRRDTTEEHIPRNSLKNDVNDVLMSHDRNDNNDNKDINFLDLPEDEIDRSIDEYLSELD